MKLLVFSNARDGRDDEFNEWYDTVHLAEVLTVPGVKSAARYRVRAREGSVPEHRYLAVYDVEGDGGSVLKEFAARSANGQFQMTDSIDTRTVKLAVWEPLS